MSKRTAIGTAMKIYRVNHDLTQWAFGKRLGIDQTYISMIERGQRQPTPDQLKKLAKLGIVPQETV